MPWGAVAGAVISTAGAALTSKGSGGSSQTDNAPWSAQQPYLKNGFQNAQDLYDQRTAQGPFTGSFYSPDNQTQLGSANQAAAYASGPGAALPNTTAQTAQTLQGTAGNYVNNAQNLATNGAGSLNGSLTGVLQNYATGQTPVGGVSSPLSSALQSAAMSGTQSLAAGQGNLQAAATNALTNQTGQTIANANQYANNPTLNAQISAAEQPVLQTLNESTVPGLNRAASMGGNLNSSRAGMAEAMANRDAATQVGNIDATMRGNAYNNGLSLAAQQQEAGTNAAISAGSAQANSGASLGLGVGNQQLAQAGLTASTQLGAANSGLSSQLGSQALNANTRLGANSQLGSGVNAGVNAATQAGTQAAGNLAIGQAAGGVSQADQNAQLQNAYQMWQQQNGSYQQGLLNSYMGAVNTGNGGTSNTTNSLPTNYLGNAVGGALGGASLTAKGGPFANLWGGNSGSNAVGSSGYADQAAMTAAMNPSTPGAYGPAY